MSRHARSTSAAVVAAARALIGIPFRHQGRSVRGLDCLGLGARAFTSAGLPIRDRTNYPREPNPREMIGEFDSQFIRLPRKHPIVPGLLILFHDAGWIHVGVSTPGGIVHSRGPEKVGPGVVEHRVDEQSWAPRIKGMWRHPDMEWDH